jgi:hypothetical protein
LFRGSDYDRFAGHKHHEGFLDGRWLYYDEEVTAHLSAIEVDVVGLLTNDSWAFRRCW